MIKIDNNFDSREWLETNGTGGFASANLDGSNSRRYHGLFFIEANSERYLLLSKLDETIIYKNQKFDLSNQNYLNGKSANNYLKTFEQNLYPKFTYEVENIKVTKSIVMAKYRNVIFIKYETDSTEEFELEFNPLVAFRSYHSLNKRSNINPDYIFQDGIFSMRPDEKLPGIFITTPSSTFESKPAWHYDFFYQEEQARGYDYLENLFSPGKIKVKLGGKKKEVLVCISIRLTNNPEELFNSELERREKITRLHQSSLAKKLSLASDKLVVNKSDCYSIIAGFPWFTSWSRDSLISCLGISLALKDFNITKDILLASANSLNSGMIPNYEAEGEKDQEFNSIDAPLLFINTSYKYYKRTGQISVVKQLLPSILSIINNYEEGTFYHIKMSPDGLISTPTGGLTWMDAKINNYCVTPRLGKAVDINALWYNALKIAELFCWKSFKFLAALKLRKTAKLVQKNFIDKFYNNSGYLNDSINFEVIDDSVRPNQLFALGLPYTMLDPNQAASILKIVDEKLLTTYGLKTLSSDSKDYRGVISGDQLSRDSAYHQGTVWPFLLGIYTDSVIKYGTKEQKAKIKEIIKNLESELETYCINGLAEIYDGDSPKPRGCISQAWSVAEIFRSHHNLSRL